MMSELHARRPAVGIARVRRVFRQQCDAGRVECMGCGLPRLLVADWVTSPMYR